MKIVEQSHKIEAIMPENPLEHIERIARVCYKSEDKIKDGSAAKLVKGLLSAKPFPHEAMIEHAFVCVRFITDRGVSNELVRHRLCAFAQESTRYVKYKDGMMEFIKPVWYKACDSRYPSFGSKDQWRSLPSSEWHSACLDSEKRYFSMIESGSSPQEARQALNNSVKTEIMVTANLREWRHILKLRCDSHAHPQMRELMLPLLEELKTRIPVVFDDINTIEG